MSLITDPPPARTDVDRAFLVAAVRCIELRLERADHGREQRIEDQRLHDAHAALEGAERNEPSFVVLARRFELTPFEYWLLLLCVANEMSARVPVLCGRVCHSPGPFVSLAVARETFPNLFDWSALGSDRPLRRLRLIELNQAPGRGLLTAALWLDERVLRYVQGGRALDDLLRAWFTPVQPPPWAGPLPDSHLDLAYRIHDALVRCPRGATLPVVQLVGPDRPSKELIAHHVTAHQGRTLYRVSVEALPASATELDALARVWERECLLLPTALYLDAADIEPDGAAKSESPTGTPPAFRTVLRLLARTHRVVYLAVRDRWPLAGAGREVATFDVDRPTPEEQEDAWACALGGTPVAGKVAQALSGEFDLNTATIRQVASSVPIPAPGAPPPEHQHWANALWDDCRREVRPRLEALAAHLDPRADWDHLVLPELPRAQLREIAAQIRCRPIVHRRWGLSDRVSRGLGLSVLFAGESGTGKTLAAEVMACSLRLDLFVIDLSAVVSKYIGETEKNLRQVFDAAEQGGSVLLFNEADALFGKRSAVKDSHDRYANIQIDYLLQRMEEFRGLAILTTNRKENLDRAFLRRLRFVVEFPFPEVEQRVQIWRRLLPPLDPKADVKQLMREMFALLADRRACPPPRVIPTRDLNYDVLGSFPLAGGAAFNASVNAAFRAAGSKPPSPVGMEYVLPAIRAELLKARKPFRESDFEPAAVPAARPDTAARIAAARRKVAGRGAP